MTVWIAFVILTGLVIANWIRFRDWMYPALLQAVLWAVIAAWFGASQAEYLPVSFTTWAVIVLGSLSFAAGCFVSTFGHRPFPGRNWIDERFMPSQIVWWGVALVPLIALPFFIERAIAVASTGTSPSWFT